MPNGSPARKLNAEWVAPGDLNAFVGLSLDNVANLVLTVLLLKQSFGLDETFSLTHMIPGTAFGVLVGDLLLTWLTFRTAKKLGRKYMTAMPLGLDTPSTFGMIFFVVGPAYLHGLNKLQFPPAEAADYAWKIGMASIVTSGVFKLVCALGSGWIRRVVPEAGLLGSLTAIALALISFLPLMDVLGTPIAGLAALAVILTTLTARIAAPLKIPGGLASLAVGALVYYVARGIGGEGFAPESAPLTSLGVYNPWPTLAWTEVYRDSLNYLPIVLPFALATVVGGIDCTASASAAGDHFDTRAVIGAEAIATLVAGLCGGVIQSTPYIGHPAYKAMGGRAGYTLATALFIGGAGIFGYCGHLYAWLPKAAVFPILVFVGLEITAHSFGALAKRYYPALVFACIPAMAQLVVLFLDQAQGSTTLPPHVAAQFYTVRALAGGFIMTSLLWGAALSALIDRKLSIAALYLFFCAAASLFGVIHSPLPGSAMFLPFDLSSFELRLPDLPAGSAHQTPIHLALGYTVAAAILLFWSIASPPQPSAPETLPSDSTAP